VGDHPAVSERLAIVVPGHGVRAPDGEHLITDRCRLLILHAARLAERLHPAAVVFSGWSSSGGRSEAEQMRDAWPGPEVPLLVETAARSTAENASRTLPLLHANGIETAVVVCAPLHALRTWLLFGRVYRRGGVHPRLSVARVAPTPRALAWELAALPLAPFQLLASRREERR
jgi:uncharacterized SAM-binding protein YcdF (DUF218 family)